MAQTEGDLPRDLDKILAGFYPGEADARRVVKRADIPTHFVQFSGNAVVMWSGIIEEARRRRRVVSVIDAALEDYQGDPDLVRARSEVVMTERAGPIPTPAPQRTQGTTIESGRESASLAGSAQHLAQPVAEVSQARNQPKTRDDQPAASPSNASDQTHRTNPWIPGLFYLFVMIVLIVIVGGMAWFFIKAGIPAAGALSMVLAIVLACAGVLIILGTLQQMQDKTITEANALERMKLGLQAIRDAGGPGTKDESKSGKAPGKPAQLAETGSQPKAVRPEPLDTSMRDIIGKPNLKQVEESRETLPGPKVNGAPTQGGTDASSEMAPPSAGL